MILPNIHTLAIGIRTIEIIASAFVQNVGFSSGCVLFGPKNPPPFVPSCLIARKAATGPRAMICSDPSSVVACAAPAIVIGMPPIVISVATTSASGSSTRNVARCTSMKKLPNSFRPARPRAIAASAAIPVAADTNWSHISEQSCVK